MDTFKPPIRIEEPIKESGQLTFESSEEEESQEEATVLAPDVGELLVLQRILHFKESSKKESQREHIFHSQS